MRLTVRRISSNSLFGAQLCGIMNISAASIESILSHLDQQVRYSEKVLKNGNLMILPAGCSHLQFDALSRPRIYQDDSFCCDIHLLHRKGDKNSSLESILLHELGHVLNLSLTGDISAVPEDFFTFGELFFPGPGTTYREQAPEFFAHCFQWVSPADLSFSNMMRSQQLNRSTRDCLTPVWNPQLPRCHDYLT